MKKCEVQQCQGIPTHFGKDPEEKILYLCGIHFQGTGLDTYEISQFLVEGTQKVCETLEKFYGILSEYQDFLVKEQEKLEKHGKIMSLGVNQKLEEMKALIIKVQLLYSKLDSEQVSYELIEKLWDFTDKYKGQWQFSFKLSDIIDYLRKLPQIFEIAEDANHIYLDFFTMLSSLFLYFPSNSQNKIESFSLLGHDFDRCTNHVYYDISSNTFTKAGLAIYPAINYPLSLNLPLNYLFIYGGRYNDQDYSSKFYFLHKPTNKIIFESQFKPFDHYTGAIFTDLSIYFFGGNFQNNYTSEAFQYNFTNNSWIGLSRLPEAAPINNPVSYDHEFILLTGFNLNCIYIYSKNLNFYEKKYEKMNKNQGKFMITFKNQVFLFYDDLIFRLNDLNEADIVGRFKMPKFSIKESIEVEDGVYFRDYGNLFKFTFANFEVKCLIDADYS